MSIKTIGGADSVTAGSATLAFSIWATSSWSSSHCSQLAQYGNKCIGGVSRGSKTNLCFSVVTLPRGLSHMDAYFYINSMKSGFHSLYFLQNCVVFVQWYSALSASCCFTWWGHSRNCSFVSGDLEICIVGTLSPDVMPFFYGAVSRSSTQGVGATK